MPQVSQGLTGSGVTVCCSLRGPTAWRGPPGASSGEQRGLADRRGAACFPAGPGASILGLLPSRGLYFPASTLEPKTETDFKRTFWKQRRQQSLSLEPPWSGQRAIDEGGASLACFLSSAVQCVIQSSQCCIRKGEKKLEFI